MRILPLTNGFNSIKKTNNSQTRFERNEAVNLLANHQYTGIASVDLAYASMFDYEIAKDLKLMGLI